MWLAGSWVVFLLCSTVNTSRVTCNVKKKEKKRETEYSVNQFQMADDSFKKIRSFNGLVFLQLITAEANSRLRIYKCKQVWFHLVPDFIIFFSNILYFSIFIPRFLTQAPFKLQQNLTSDKSPPLEFLDTSIYKKSICYSSCEKHICTVHWGWTTKKAFQKNKSCFPWPQFLFYWKLL